MIVHVVLFEPRSDLSPSQRAEVVIDLRRAAEAVPSIRRFRVGRRIRHGLPGYEQAMIDDYSYAAIIEFDDEEGLKAYLQHPGHLRIGEHFAASASHALAYDFRMVDAAEAADLISG